MTSVSEGKEDTAPMEQCSICFDPAITSTTTTAATSFGLSGSGLGPAMSSSYGPTCSGVTTINPAAASAVGQGDYLEIIALQPGTGTSTSVSTPGTTSDAAVINRICGVYFNAAQRNPAPTAITTHATACSYSVPFRVGVHMDDKESIQAPPAVASPNFDKAENNAITATGSGQGYQGFYLNYWQASC